MRQKPVQHHLDTLMALLLFGAFSVCVLAVLLTGANTYRRLTQRDQAAYDNRSCVQYVSTRLRQGDTFDNVSVEDFYGCDALTVDNGGYLTRVYCYQGKLMELYSETEATLLPEDGEIVMDLEWMEMSMTDGLFQLRVPDASGGIDTLVLSLRSGKEGTV